MPAVYVRGATDADADAVVALWTEAYVTLGVGGRSAPYELADFEDSARGGELFVVDGAGGVVGAVVLYPPDTPDRVVAGPGEAELSRLAVASGARRRGVGRALAEHCLARARARGWDSIVLWSRPAQIEAHRLYESLGFRRLPGRDSVDAGGHGRVVFGLTLRNGSGRADGTLR